MKTKTQKQPAYEILGIQVYTYAEALRIQQKFGGEIYTVAYINAARARSL